MFSAGLLVCWLFYPTSAHAGFSSPLTICSVRLDPKPGTVGNAGYITLSLKASARDCADPAVPLTVTWFCSTGATDGSCTSDTGYRYTTEALRDLWRVLVLVQSSGLRIEVFFQDTSLVRGQQVRTVL